MEFGRLGTNISIEEKNVPDDCISSALSLFGVLGTK